MTRETTTTTDDSQNGNKKPNFYAKLRQVSYGKKATYERIGVAWLNEDGSLYVKLVGTQVSTAGSRFIRWRKTTRREHSSRRQEAN